MFRRHLTFPGSCPYSLLKGEGTHLRIQGGSPARKTRASSGIFAASLEFQQELAPWPLPEQLGWDFLLSTEIPVVCAEPLGLCPAEANNMEMLGCLTPVDKTCGQSAPAETETEKPEPDGLERGPPGMGGSLAIMPHPTYGSQRSLFRSPHLALWGRMGMGSKGEKEFKDQSKFCLSDLSCSPRW